MVEEGAAYLTTDSCRYFFCGVIAYRLLRGWQVPGREKMKLKLKVRVCVKPFFLFPLQCAHDNFKIKAERMSFGQWSPVVMYFQPIRSKRNSVLTRTLAFCRTWHLLQVFASIPLWLMHCIICSSRDWPDVMRQLVISWFIVQINKVRINWHVCLFLTTQFFPLIMQLRWHCFSNLFDYRKTKAKIVTLADQERFKQHNKPNKNLKQMHETGAERGKTRVRITRLVLVLHVSHWLRKWCEFC